MEVIVGSACDVDPRAKGFGIISLPVSWRIRGSCHGAMSRDGHFQFAFLYMIVLERRAPSCAAANVVR